MRNMYDLCVIGAGMIGSSAAKYAAMQGFQTCLIGPQEPSVKSKNDGRFLYGAYYDEARITRCSAIDPHWALLARQSIKRYRNIETSSGVSFYTEVGYLTTKPADEILKYYGDEWLTLTPDQTMAKFPYVSIDKDCLSVYEETNAGYINPRKLVEAQQQLAISCGAEILAEVAVSVVERSVDDYRLVVTTDRGTTVLTKKVLLATSGYTHLYPLLPTQLHPRMTFMTQAVVLAQVAPHDLTRMRAMPSLTFSFDKKAHGVDKSCYILPPVLYPDGKHYIKLGHMDQFERPLHTKEDIKSWFCSPVPEDIVEGLLTIMRKHFPGFNPVSVKSDSCLTCDTPTGRLYIDMATPDICVALGCNGRAAKSCDEIGRIAATLVTKQEWDTELPRNDYRLQLVTDLLID